MTMSPVSWYWCLLLLGLSGALATQKMPRFHFQPSNKVLLTWGDTWEVGTSNMMAILAREKVIIIRIAIDGDYGGGLKRILTYECPSSRTPQLIDLTTLSTSSWEVRCPSDMPFTIQPASGGAHEVFELKLGASRTLCTNVFSEKVKLSVRVECSTGVLVSNPLYVWNLEPLSSYSKSLTPPINRGFLTDAAISFMTKLNHSQEEAPFPVITFLDPFISGIIKNAPQFFKSKLNMGSILYFDAGSCLNYQLGKAILFISYFSKFDERHQNLMKLMHLDIQSGTLAFSACGLKKEVKQLFDEKRPTNTIGICTMVSFSGEVEPYLKTEAVDQRFPVSEVRYAGCTTAPTGNCQIAPNENTNVTVVSGMDNTAIVCPIICDDKSQVYRFYRDGRALIGSPNDEWSLVDGVRVSKTGNIIEFPPTVSSAHSGTYRCEAGSKYFSFYVTVVSLPHFTIASSSPTAYGLLPEKVFAMEGESLIYNCTVNFASLSSVRVTPVFYIATTNDGKSIWVNLNDREFRQKVGATNESLTLTTTATEASQTLTVTVIRVPPVNPSLLTNFSHRFECSASVDPAESQLVGMSDYKIQSGTDVLFMPRLTHEKFVLHAGNNCSVQKCSVENGASFEFALSPDTIAYLNATGVEIDAFFRLDNLLLEDVKALFANYASKVAFNRSSCKLTYKVEPITRQAVLDELRKRKSLTAVFNLRYRPGSPMTNLWHNKTAHGRAGPAVDRLDCRADPLCFYSTDFDLSVGLSDLLSVGLTFDAALVPEAPAAASSGLLIGVCLSALAVVIIVVLSAYLLMRSPERAYLVEAKEIQLGYNPRAEAKAEVFKEYLHAGTDQEEALASVPGIKRSLASTASINSRDDLELS